MGETKDDICEKLDKVLLDFFETLTQLYQTQALLDQSMKSGFLNLSRARYMCLKSKYHDVFPFLCHLKRRHIGINFVATAANNTDDTADAAAGGVWISLSGA